MGKRKPQPNLHMQEQCDVWLSTTAKKEKAPPPKRQRVMALRPISNIASITFSSQPIKAGTKQTSIQQFLARKKGQGKENQDENVQETGTNRTSRSDGNRPAAIRDQIPQDIHSSGQSFLEKSMLDEKSGEISYAEEHFRDSLAQDLVTLSDPSSIITVSDSESDSKNREINFQDLEINSRDRESVSRNRENHSTYEECDSRILKEQSRNLDSGNQEVDTRNWKVDPRNAESDTMNWERDSRNQKSRLNWKTKISPGVPSSSSSHSNTYCSEGQVSLSMAMQDFEDSQEDSDNSNDSFSLLDVETNNRTEQAYKSHKLKDLNVLRRNKFSSSRSDSPTVLSQSQGVLDTDFDTEDISFTMGTQGCLKVKGGYPQHGKDTTCYVSKRRVESTEDASAIIDSQECLKDIGVGSHLSGTSASDSTPLSNIGEDSDGIDFTMATQGYLKVRHPQSISKLKSSGSSVSTWTSNGSTTRKHVDGSFSNDYKPLSNDDDYDEDSERITFTMGSQGCLKVKDQSSNSSKASGSSVGQRTSKTQRFVEDRVPSDYVHQSYADNDSERISFTMSTQGCLKVKDPESSGGSKLRGASLASDQPGSVCEAKTLSKKPTYTGILNYSKSSSVSSALTHNVSDDDDSEEITFTIGTQGCLKLRDPNFSGKSTLGESSSILKELTNDSYQPSKSALTTIEKPRPSLISTFNSDDESEDITFTMGSQGCLVIKDPK